MTRISNYSDTSSLDSTPRQSAEGAREGTKRGSRGADWKQQPVVNIPPSRRPNEIAQYSLFNSSINHVSLFAKALRIWLNSEFVFIYLFGCLFVVFVCLFVYLFTIALHSAENNSSALVIDRQF